jgi:hypothetical protein
MSIMRWRPILTTAVICALAVVACGERAPRRPGKVVVATIDGRDLTVAELERYFEANLVEYGEEDAFAEDQKDEVLSRLFDAFVEEHLLLAEAESRGVEAHDLEVEVYIGVSADDEDAPTDLEARTEEARRRIKIEKLQEAALAEQAQVDDSDVRRYQEEQRERLAPPRRVELRALMLSSGEEANSVYDQIRRRRISFDEAVVKYQNDQGQGLPQKLEWNNLAEDVRASIEELKAGRVSKPLEIQDGFYLFQVVSWLDNPEWAEGELNRLSREELETKRRKDAYDRLLDDVRGSRKVRLYERALPFEYVPPA